MRAGNATNRQSSVINLEAGKVYYIGALYANNLTQTAKISDAWPTDRTAYLTKFPELASASILNLANQTAINCWKMNVTDEIAAGNSTLAQAVRNCR